VLQLPVVSLNGPAAQAACGRTIIMTTTTILEAA
jgi:hypothetical protein